MAAYTIHLPLLARSSSLMQQNIFPHSPKSLCNKIFSLARLSTSAQRQTKPPINPPKTFSHIYQECCSQHALNPGKQVHAYMILSGFSPTIFVSNFLIQMYVKCSSLDYACKMFDRMPQRDVVSCNAMVSAYAGSGKMDNAREVFDGTPVKDVVSWNSLISAFLNNGDCWKSIGVFLEMGRLGSVRFDRATFAVVLKACAALEECRIGVQVHAIVVRMGFDNDVVTGSAMLDMYAKCNRLDDSFQIFNEMNEKNWVSWSAMIAGCVQNDHHIEGLRLFKEMQMVGIGVSQSIYASVFRSCAGMSTLRLGTQLHGHALKCDLGLDAIVGTATLDMYAKCGSMEDAQKLFNLLPRRNLQTYNAIIIGYALSGWGFEALQLFQLLRKSGLGFDATSLSGAFSACASRRAVIEGLQIHGLVAKTAFMLNICVTNAIFDMYGKCGALLEAFRLFDQMQTRDPVSWNAIIAAHEQNGDEAETLSLFASMLCSKMEPDDFTYGSVLKACAGQQALNSGMEIHGRIIKSGMGLDPFVGSGLVDMYCKCGEIEEARKIHDRIETMVSWNAIISGFSMLEQSEDAHSFFSRMLEVGVKPDVFTYAAVLDACANLATVGLGKQVHAQIIKLELGSDVYICSTLVDMYSKCGNIQDSQLMFEKAPKRDSVTWNAMICGCAQHGLGKETLKIFGDMQLANVKPNHATFISVLRACAHMGLVDQGMQYFDDMQNEYNLDPQVEHYSCMVDIIGRSGQIDRSLKLIEEMPFEADAVIWRNLLSICKIHRNVEVAEKAATSLLHLDPQDSSAYILLSNIYADARMWDKVSEMRKVMRCNKLKKEPGCSWIEVQNEVHIFLVGDKSHPRCAEMHENLRALVGETLVGYVPHIDFEVDEEAEEREQVDEQARYVRAQSVI